MTPKEPRNWKDLTPMKQTESKAKEFLKFRIDLVDIDNPDLFFELWAKHLTDFHESMKAESEWISVADRCPDYTDKRYGIPYLVMLEPKTDDPRKNGDIVISIYYKGNFHWDFWKGNKMDVTHWQPLLQKPKK